MNPLGLTSKFFVESTQDKWDEVARVGFETAELVFPPNIPVDQSQAEAQFRRKHILEAGLTILSAHMPFGPDLDPSCLDTRRRLQTLTDQKQVLDIISSWDIPIAVIHASSEPIEDRERSARFDCARESMEALSAYARESGIVLAVEELPRTCIGRDSVEMAELLRNCPDAGVTFDFNHLLRESHQSFINRMGRRIVTTHLSDYDFVDERHWMPGIGQIQWKEVVKALLSTGYKGQLMFETYEDRGIPGELCTPEKIMDSWISLVSDI